MQGPRRRAALVALSAQIRQPERGRAPHARPGLRGRGQVPRRHEEALGPPRDGAAVLLEEWVGEPLLADGRALIALAL